MLLPLFRGDEVPRSSLLQRYESSSAPVPVPLRLSRPFASVPDPVDFSRHCNINFGHNHPEP
jgi:hypothetical protein